MMNMKMFKKICRKTQYELKGFLKKELSKFYETIINEDGFLYVPSGNVDVMLTAHMDTVHKDRCTMIQTVRREDKEALWSPQGIGGDDRCGVYMILNILKNTDLRPSIVFCEDEESGGIGSEKFATWLEKHDEATNVKYVIELDRRGSNDAVFYDCGNVDFQQYIEDITGYKEAFGSFSDIGNISPVLDVASVNLSCGYYKEHTLEHYVIPTEMENTIRATIKLLEDAGNVEKFDYQEVKYTSYYGSNYTTRGLYSAYYDDSYYQQLIVAIKNGVEVRGQYNYVSQEECVGLFLMDNPDICYNDVIYIGTVNDYDYDD